MISGGAKAGPSDAPVFAMPMPSARCRAGNHAAIVRVAPGQLPDSPSPSAARNPHKLPSPRAAACAISATDHTTTASAKPVRLPSRSKIAPHTNIDAAYAKRNDEPIHAYWTFVS